MEEKHPIPTERTCRCLLRAFPLCNISTGISVALNSVRTSHPFAHKHLAFQERVVKNEEMGSYGKEPAALHTTCQLISDSDQQHEQFPHCHACPRPLQPAELQEKLFTQSTYALEGNKSPASSTHWTIRKIPPIALLPPAFPLHQQHIPFCKSEGFGLWGFLVLFLKKITVLSNTNLHSAFEVSRNVNSEDTAFFFFFSKLLLLHTQKQSSIRSHTIFVQ